MANEHKPITEPSASLRVRQPMVMRLETVCMVTQKASGAEDMFGVDAILETLWSMRRRLAESNALAKASNTTSTFFYQLVKYKQVGTTNSCWD